MHRLLWIGGAVLVVAIAALAAWMWHAMMGPMYQPGNVRAGKDVAGPLTPAGASAERWLVAPGIELHHFEEGAGTPILVIHGGPGFPPAGPWRAGTLLGKDYRLIYYHQRGCGLSSRPIARFSGSNMYANMQLANRTLGLPAQVADIERIRRILGADKLVLMGHSFGALLAALYAAEFPEHVAASIYVAPADLTVLPNKEGDLFDLVRRRLSAELRPEFESYMAEYFDFRRAFQRSEEESGVFYGRFARFYGAAAGGAADAGAGAAAGGGVPQTGDVSAAGYEPLAVYCGMGKHHDYSAALRAVTTPGLTIHGSLDMQPESVSRGFAARFPNCRFTQIDGASHFVFEDRPEEFAGQVREFLKGI
jgi:proline iminopeptidase